MRSAIIGFALGVGWLQCRAALPAWQMQALLAVAALALAVFARMAPRGIVSILLLGAGGAASGFAWAALQASLHLAQELPKEWEGRDVTVVGTIDSLPSHAGQGVRFNFAVERVVSPQDAAPAVPGRLALSWYTAFRADEQQPAAQVQPGERWQLTVRLRRPHGNANPYGFDYEVWLLEQNLRATGGVRPDRDLALKNRRLDEFVPSFGNIVERSRGLLRERILAALPGKEYAGVIVALVIGDQRAVGHGD